MEVTVTVKNYRSFSQEEPLRFRLGTGLMALVGPNNSGKTSVLKLFHELKHLWESIANNVNIYAGNGFSINYEDIYDPIEIFCDRNTAPLSISFEFPSQGGRYIGNVELNCERAQPTTWTLRARVAPDNIWITPTQGISTDASGNLNFSQQGVAIHSHVTNLMFDLRNILYLPPFRNAINEGAAQHYGLLVGTGFIDTWNEWKTGGDKTRNRKISLVTEDIKRIFGYEKLEIVASEKLKTLGIEVNGRPFKLREMGAGITQFILALGNAAIKTPSFVLIDEPELNLQDRKSTRLNSSHIQKSRMPSSA